MNTASIARKLVSERSSRNVLLVEDSVDDAMLAEHELIKKGYRVFIARNSMEAMSVISGKQVDLAIVDLRLPGRDGVDVALTLREFYPNLPLLILTGFAKTAHLSRILDCGFLCAPKPFRFEQLIPLGVI